MRKYFLLILFLVSISQAQIFTQADVEVCNSKFELATTNGLKNQPIGTVVTEIGKSFLGLGYEANTLEQASKETLIVHLTGLDCYTFLESSLAIARLVKEDSTNFENYLKELENIRYRDGKINEYSSRLHYFSDWIYEMDKRNIAKDITKEIGGKKFNSKINFMSTHPDYYKQLKDNPKYVAQMKQIEKEISSRDYYYLPENEIEKYEKNIMSGDILGITTNIEGLDISHTGIAIRMQDNRIHLMHAPNKGKKIQISAETLADYIKRNSKQTGIIVARPLEP